MDGPMHSRPLVLLTGSAGRVGKALRATMAPSWNLLPYSRIPDKACLPLSNLSSPNSPILGDALIHAAWSSVPATAESAGPDAARPDLDLLASLLANCAASPNPPLFIFLSTGAVYGNAGPHPSTESDPPAPIGRYASAKLQAESLIRASGLPHAILRISNLYGIPSHPNDAQGAVGKLIHAARSGQPFTRWGSDSTKDYLHGSDCFRALDLIVRSRLQGLWNIASGRPTRLSELVSLVETTTQLPITITNGPPVPWDVSDNRIDPSRFIAATGWNPLVSLETGLQLAAANI